MGQITVHLTDPWEDRRERCLQDSQQSTWLAVCSTKVCLHVCVTHTGVGVWAAVFAAARNKKQAPFHPDVWQLTYQTVGRPGRPQVPHSTLFLGAKENSRGTKTWTQREERPLRGPDELSSLRARWHFRPSKTGKDRCGMFINRGQQSKLEHNRHCFRASKS